MHGAIETDIFEIGSKSATHEIVRRCGLGAFFLELGAHAQRGVVHQGLKDFLLGAVIIVESARGQSGFADNVAHRCGAIALFGKNLTRGIQDGGAVAHLGLFSLAEGRIGWCLLLAHSV